MDTRRNSKVQNQGCEGGDMKDRFLEDHKAIRKDIEGLKKEHKEINDEVKDQHLKTIQTIEARHTAIRKDIEGLKKEHKEINDEVKDQHLKTRQTIEARHTAIRKDIVGLKKEHKEINEEVKDQHLKTRSTIETRHTEMLHEITKLQNEQIIIKRNVMLMQQSISQHISNLVNHDSRSRAEHTAILTAIKDLKGAKTDLQDGQSGDTKPTASYHPVRVPLSKKYAICQKRRQPINEPLDRTDRELYRQLEELYEHIKHTSRHEQARDLLRRLYSNETDKERFRERVTVFFSKKPEEMTLLELVANHDNPAGEQGLLNLVLQLFPMQMNRENGESIKTPTALHILVYNRNIKGARVLLKFAYQTHQLENVLSAEVIDEKYEKTRMMGEIPLFIAALSFDYEMVEFLIGEGAKVSTIVSGGNTVFHLLVKYASFYPAHRTDVQNMINMLEMLNEDDLQTQGNVNTTIREMMRLSLWYTANNKGQTVLQLAALLGQHKLFKWMLELEGVYIKYEQIFGHIDCVQFNINEIDYVALNRFRNSSCCLGRCRERENATKMCSRAPSVIEIICETMETDKAYHFIKIPPIDDIIDMKLNHYKVWLIIWFILHLVIMALLAAQAVVKALLINDSHQLMSTTQAITFESRARVVLFVCGIMYLVLEILGVYNRCPRCIFQDKRNWDYHVLLIVFSLCLVGDAIWSWIRGPQNIYFLAIALVVGCLFLPFFLRPWEFFSVFTAMVRSALLQDGFRFGVIILFDFVAFSFAMYVLYLPTPGGPPTEFEHLGVTVLTMFTLMLGLTDLEILTRAPFPWLTVTLFIIFVVLTYILMFNILVALMTSTCNEMSENRKLQWKLQRLALVVMTEHIMPLCFAFNTGVWDKLKKRYFSTRFYYENQIPLTLLREQMEENNAPDPTTPGNPTDGNASIGNIRLIENHSPSSCC